jgi:alkylated DNA repair dioxygenase AlkB
MTITLQASLLDAADHGTDLGTLGGSVERTTLGGGAWVDLLPGWVGGADALFSRLVDVVPWHAEKRQMYERVVDVPRLLSWYGESDALPDRLLDQARNALSAYYGPELGEPLPHGRAVLLPRRA